MFNNYTTFVQKQNSLSNIGNILSNVSSHSTYPVEW